MKIRQEQRQKQMLSQNMIQSVQILQMGALELSDYLKEVSLENPLVELEEHGTGTIQEERLKKQEWLSNLDDSNRIHYNYDTQEHADLIENIKAETKETLADYLHMELLGGAYSDWEMEIFDFIAQSLDSRGYYTDSLTEISRHFSISEEEAQKYLEIMKDLEPIGVCTASLQECLMKQLEKKYTDCEIEKKIVKDYMELLGKNQLNVIARELKISLEEVKLACENVKKLNPKPARGFDTGELFSYIEPDITVVKFEDYFEILVNNYSCPTFYLSHDYLNMMKSECSEEVKEYLELKVKQVEKMNECISRRYSTLLELAKCIVEVQKDFFLYGKKELKPFRFMDAAEKIGVHESTISRAVKNKYLQCCWGIYPLHYFFARGMNSKNSDAEIATCHIKQQLKILIDEENKQKTYSDQQLAQLLAEQGIEISRRTVAKYRESMGIASARERKIF